MQSSLQPTVSHEWTSSIYIHNVPTSYNDCSCSMLDYLERIVCMQMSSVHHKFRPMRIQESRTSNTVQCQIQCQLTSKVSTQANAVQPQIQYNLKFSTTSNQCKWMTQARWPGVVGFLYIYTTRYKSNFTRGSRRHRLKWDWSSDVSVYNSVIMQGIFIST